MFDLVAVGSLHLPCGCRAAGSDDAADLLRLRLPYSMRLNGHARIENGYCDACRANFAVFSGALAIVLFGLSIFIYGLVRSHLQHEAVERTSAVLDALVAAVEFTPKGLVWEPEDRRLEFGPAA